MRSVKIFHIGKAKEPWLIEALAEYEKRLTPYMRIETKMASSDKQLVEWARPEKNCYALDPKGKVVETLVEMVQPSRCAFVIGGPDGLPKELELPKISLSALTFTHQMTRLILVEQIYRAVTLIESRPYVR